MIRQRGARDGFALVTVLWAMVAASILALAGALAGRATFEGARNRIHGERAYWLASECLQRGRAVVNDLLASVSDDARPALWRDLDRHVLASPLVVAPGCELSIEASGARVDVNAADEAQLQTLFEAVGIPQAAAVAAAIVNRRATDRFADVRELHLIPDLAQAAPLDSLVGVEPGPVPINSARLTVLASVPGFGPDALEHARQLRESRIAITDLRDFAAQLPPPAAELFIAHFPEITRLVAIDPEAWILTAVGRDGEPEITATIEVRVVQDGARATIVRRRTW